MKAKVGVYAVWANVRWANFLNPKVQDWERLKLSGQLHNMSLLDYCCAAATAGLPAVQNSKTSKT